MFAELKNSFNISNILVEEGLWAKNILLYKEYCIVLYIYKIHDRCFTHTFGIYIQQDLQLGSAMEMGIGLQLMRLVVYQEYFKKLMQPYV